ncbi:tRNA threonylcarbamoyl adenosine modification protein YeaZ [Actinoplanes campanulatus]|uniref:tRNA threonylcarbamoyl adenosine modification protein YeaZ n=1 Tax=Actinoplanes campanulatus TaxID=113559 RepID=A0A7W5AJJ6_9ACTN|nr:tRNA (adenosine(37)-N6)-threonylcarbamoyltransferase complex dimerization subunit type 1 TsaB [Actinoplanes campanulatus]MBB3097472.1 tRNA threonylcarbamoyl adenosine modification protein YeaZ [Actinoplanes campanulatus]GGN27036.1 tRNA (adenosine(37)-N6)-threonylcarbamoyltransferase complex dimerization subunit type 1 TsaB [Actinoplanes campanulatus]GID38066.1 tRNA (adenosine(37)-N6)-threonylcarbamoyltransferase complex dimerization subunit type 1 TsaB [Actinoplanes campanulatus]
MLVLALDTATPASTAALVEVTVDGLTGVAERRTVDPRAHGERLAPEIAAVLADAGLRPRDVTAIVAGVGPGPFTGLRVGLATAASMGQALGIPTYAVCSLDALGRAAGPGRVLIATDARRREVYFATYADGERVTGPEVAKPADVAALVRGATGGSLPAGVLVGAEEAGGGTSMAGLVERVAGEGALKYGDVFGVPVEEHLLYPPGAALVALAAERIRAGAPGEALTPLYLRRPDAVEPSARKAVLT